MIPRKDVQSPSIQFKISHRNAKWKLEASWRASYRKELITYNKRSKSQQRTGTSWQKASWWIKCLKDHPKFTVVLNSNRFTQLTWSQSKTSSVGRSLFTCQRLKENPRSWNLSQQKTSTSRLRCIHLFKTLPTPGSHLLLECNRTQTIEGQLGWSWWSTRFACLSVVVVRTAEIHSTARRELMRHWLYRLCQISKSPLAVRSSRLRRKPRQWANSRSVW